MAQPRQHAVFGGRNVMEELERQVRSIFCVHLVVPGRKQAGPVAVAGKSYREVLFLLNRTQLELGTVVHGRIQRHVQNPQDMVLEGRWYASNCTASSAAIQPYWLFKSEFWNILVCPLTTNETLEHDDNKSNDTTSKTLQTCLDNALGQDDPQTAAFCAGDLAPLTVLYEEVTKTLGAC